jgi:CheY-like chemotaxis protein
MNKQSIELLVVDDEEFIREVLDKLLSDTGYVVSQAVDGEEAWEILDSEQHKFSAILLDRVMPRLDGMGLLLRIKSDKRFANIPVIFQTGINHPVEIAEGIKTGAFYYLVKPVDKEVLFAIVDSAVSTYHFSDAFRHAVRQEQTNLAHILLRSQFKLRTLSEARTLAAALSNYYPDPQRVALGISELLINAVEHGNLGISYQEKSRLLLEGAWEDEIVRRLDLPEHAGKMVDVQLVHSRDEIRLTISDCGAGFNNLQYMEMSAERAYDPNGRGIAMSKMMSFDTLEYMGNGNQLVAVVKI